MSARVLLMEIGAGPLPAVTPVLARSASWVPFVHQAAPIAALDVSVVSVANGVVMSWPHSLLADSVYVIEYGTGEDGPWTELARTTSARYVYNAAGEEPWWFRLRTVVRGRQGPVTIVQGEPAPAATEENLELLTEELIELQRQIDAERLERFNTDAAEAAARAAALQAERAERAAAIAAAQGRINDILSDSIISADEKPQLVRDYQLLQAELPGIRAEAQASEATAPLAAYEASLDALTDYLETLTTPTRWDDTSGITRIT